MISSYVLGEIARQRADLVLRDGTSLRVRPVRGDDAPFLIEGLSRLSQRSRLMRFLAPKTGFSSAELRYLTEIDHYDHEALSAITRPDGQGIAIARYVRDRTHPDSAEVGIAVVDDWQHRGVGTALLELLQARASDAKIVRFTGLVSSENDVIPQLLRRLDGVVRRACEDGHVVRYEIAF
jgi:RimJ/RimL family protein N-acetyltransferase